MHKIQGQVAWLFGRTLCRGKGERPAADAGTHFTPGSRVSAEHSDARSLLKRFYGSVLKFLVPPTDTLTDVMQGTPHGPSSYIIIN